MTAVFQAGLGTETELVLALQRGDESAFRDVVAFHHAGLRRVARLHVPDTIVDDVVQETWIAVVRGIDRFEARSSLKTWIYRILLNQARKRGPRERRTVPFSPGDPDSIVPLERLVHPDLGPHYWPDVPPSWEFDPEDRAVAAELRQLIADVIETLPGSQREVITLRDVEGWDSDEVCETLMISASNQRVLLHRARTAVRRQLEGYFDGS